MKKLYVLTLIVVCVFSFSSISFATQAQDFDSYVDYKQVQHRTYWNKNNKLYQKFWRLVFGIIPAVDRGNVSDPNGFDELISKIENITISFETTDDTCNDWDGSYQVGVTKTYDFSQIVKMAHMGYSNGICPWYDKYLGQWVNPPLGDPPCFQNFDLTLNIPEEDFSITTAECGRWYIVVTFDDTSSIDMFDFWTRWDDPTAQMVPFAEIDYTGNSIPDGNSSRFNVNIKSFKCYRLPDKDTPGKNNLVLRWTPINPAFNGDPQAPQFWPGLHTRLGVAWEDDYLGRLEYSRITHSNWSAFWVNMPAHLGHYFLPWQYVEHIQQNTTIKGFKILFQVRTNDGSRLRQQSSTNKVFKIKKLYKNYRRWK